MNVMGFGGEVYECEIVDDKNHEEWEDDENVIVAKLVTEADRLLVKDASPSNFLRQAVEAGVTYRQVAPWRHQNVTWVRKVPVDL